MYDFAIIVFPTGTARRLGARSVPSVRLTPYQVGERLETYLTRLRPVLRTFGFSLEHGSSDELMMRTYVEMVRSGDSGGALFDSRGRVVAVTSTAARKGGVSVAAFAGTGTDIFVHTLYYAVFGSHPHKRAQVSAPVRAELIRQMKLRFTWMNSTP